MAKEKRTLCVAGKNDIASNFLEWATKEFSDSIEFRVICNTDDHSKHTWQKSLRFTAKQLAIEEITLAEALKIRDLVFLSLEFDRIVNPSDFETDQLYNVHFSKLPAYRGTATSVWPLFYGEKTSGVTLHYIDNGIDTGDLIDQIVFPLSNSITSGELYREYTEHGLSLVKRNLVAMIQNNVNSIPQDPFSATYYGRKEVDFCNPPISFRKTSWQVHNAIRAFTFHEYQYPAHPVCGEILTSRVTECRSTLKPGHFVRTGTWSGRLSTLDYDLCIVLSPYRTIFNWARGEVSSVANLEMVINHIDISRPDRNGWTPLNVAAYHGNSKACADLLDHGADPNAVGLRGTHSLMYAKEAYLRTGSAKAFELLIERGADATQRDVFGFSTIDYLDSSANLALLRKLIR